MAILYTPGVIGQGGILSAFILDVVQPNDGNGLPLHGEQQVRKVCTVVGVWFERENESHLSILSSLIRNC